MHKIVVEVENCDGNKVVYSYKDVEELKAEWYLEDEMPNIPMLDDVLIEAYIDGVVVRGKTFEDAMKYIGAKYNWIY